MRNEPFRILVLGDFSGRANRAAETGDLSGRRPRKVDRDDLDATVAALSASLRLPAPGGGTLTLVFKSMGDFRPEAVVRQVASLARLAGLRKRLRNPVTFGAAAEEMREWVGEPTEVAAAKPTARPQAPVSEASFLDQILSNAGGDGDGDAPEAAVAPTAPQDQFQALIREVAGPSLAELRTPGRHPRQDEYVAKLDDVIASALGPILHHADFLALEANWRGLQRLVRRLETGGGLDVLLLDATRAELAGDLGVSGALTRSDLHRLLVDDVLGIPGAVPWTLIVGAYSFDATPADVAVLLRAAKVARAAGAVFLAAADGRLVGCPDVSASADPDDWTLVGDASGRDIFAAFRRLPEAQSAALAWPRVLLRAPHGPDDDEDGELGYDEAARGLSHAQLVWGNGAFLVAEMLGEAWSREGWDLRGALESDRDGLPAYVRDDDGEQVLVPSAEAHLSERAMEAVRERGVLPLVSHRGAATVRVGSLASLAEPTVELAGRWARE